jgi:hypothetical protein
MSWSDWRLAVSLAVFIAPEQRSSGEAFHIARAYAGSQDMYEHFPPFYSGHRDFFQAIVIGAMAHYSPHGLWQVNLNG